VSKLLVVSEGVVGNTSLLRVLRGEDFNQDEETTHGIRVEKLELVYLSEGDLPERFIPLFHIIL